MLIENGQKQIFYSHFGAITVATVLLAGPEDTLKYIRELEPTEYLMNNIWAEGGILYNADERRVMFWGGDTIAAYPYLRRPLLKLLPALWPGWSIDWAMHGVADLASALGWDVWKVLEDDFDDTDFLRGDGAVVTEAQLTDSLIADKAKTLITVRKKNGEISDYFFSAHPSLGEAFFSPEPYKMLSPGPQLITFLDAQSTAPLPQEGNEQEPDRGALIDEETHILWVWDKELDPRYLEALARRWLGWQVKGHVEGLIRHVQLSGRDATPLMLPEEQVNQQLLQELVDFQGFDPDRLAQAIRQTLPAEEQQNIKFAPGFFSVDTPPLTSQERRTILENLLSQANNHLPNIGK